MQKRLKMQTLQGLNEKRCEHCTSWPLQGLDACEGNQKSGILLELHTVFEAELFL